MNTRISILLFSISFCSFCGSAQIVNVESARMQSDTVGWLGGADGAVTLSQNKVKVFGMEAEAHFQYKTSNDKGIWLILGNYGFLSGGGVKYTSNRFFHLRYNYKLSEHVRWEVFGQIQDNLITQIASRVLVGTGPRFKIVKNKILRLYAASLVMYENEREKTIPVVKHSDIRSSSYVSFTYTPRDNIEVISTTFFQPLIKKFSDYRILNQFTFKVKVVNHFGLSLKWNYLHDRFPAGTAPRTTYAFSTGVNYEL